jgi:hypothetical protein
VKNTNNKSTTNLTKSNNLIKINVSPPQISFISAEVGYRPSISSDFLGARVFQPTLQYNASKQQEYEKYHLIPTFSIDYGIPHDTLIPIFAYTNEQNGQNGGTQPNQQQNQLQNNLPHIEYVKLSSIIDDVITWFNLFFDPHGGGRLTTTITSFGEFIPFESILDYRYKIGIGVRQRGSKTPTLNLLPRLAPFNSHINIYNVGNDGDNNNTDNDNGNNNNGANSSSNSIELLEHQRKRVEYLQLRKSLYEQRQQELLEKSEKDEHSDDELSLKSKFFQLKKSQQKSQHSKSTTINGNGKKANNNNNSTTAGKGDNHDNDQNADETEKEDQMNNIDNDKSFKDIAGAVSITSGLAVYSLGTIETTRSTPLFDQTNNNEYVQIQRSLNGGHHVHICIVTTPFNSKFKHEFRSIISESNHLDITIVFVCVNSHFTSKWLKLGRKHFYDEFDEPQLGNKIHFVTSWELGRGHIIVQDVLNKVYKRVLDQISPIPLVLKSTDSALATTANNNHNEHK